MPQSKRRRFAPAFHALERRLPLDGDCDCDCDMPPAEMGEISLPPIEEIFADDPAPEDLIPPPMPDDPDSDPTPDLLDSLPVLEPEEPEPPDAELGLPPFLPLPPAPIEPGGPA